MSRKYKITNQQGIYFVTFTIVGWVDIFIRNEYKYIFIDSIKYCQIHKGLEVYAWCIMTSHVHLIIGKNGANKIEDIIRDLKSFTSRNIKNAILNNYQESRRQWMMWIFTKAGENNSRNNEFQFWIQDSHPIELNTNAMMEQKLNYIHNNPVESGFVYEPEHWIWSSAADYAGVRKGFIDIKFIE